MVTDQERVMQAGCNACVSKPIDFRLLKRHLAASLPDFPLCAKESSMPAADE
jgi:BarA-like signal transduction histidine kinase